MPSSPAYLKQLNGQFDKMRNAYAVSWYASFLTAMLEGKCSIHNTRGNGTAGQQGQEEDSFPNRLCSFAYVEHGNCFGYSWKGCAQVFSCCICCHPSE